LWFDPGLAGLFIISTLLHLGEDINLLDVSKAITFGEIFYASCLMSLIKEWENWFAPSVISSSSPVVANIIATGGLHGR
jgi:hypothetical protein